MLCIAIAFGFVFAVFAILFAIYFAFAKKGARSVLANFYDCVSLIYILMGLLAYLDTGVQKLKF